MFIGIAVKNVANGYSFAELTELNEEGICRLQAKILWWTDYGLESAQELVNAIGQQLRTGPAKFWEGSAGEDI